MLLLRLLMPPPLPWQRLLPPATPGAAAGLAVTVVFHA